MSKENKEITNDDVNSIVKENTKRYLEYLNRQIRKNPEFVDFRIIDDPELSIELYLSYHYDSDNTIYHRFNLINPETGEWRQKDIGYEFFPEYSVSFKNWLKENTDNGHIQTIHENTKSVVNEYLIKKKQKIGFHRNWKQYCSLCDRDDFKESEIIYGWCINCKKNIKRTSMIY